VVVWASSQRGATLVGVVVCVLAVVGLVRVLSPAGGVAPQTSAPVAPDVPVVPVPSDLCVGAVAIIAGAPRDGLLCGGHGADDFLGNEGNDFVSDGDGGIDVCDDRDTNVECEIETNNGDPVGGDSDGDGVDDAVEAIFGLVPGSADSDGDGLSDRFEIEKSVPFLWPDDADSDDDGIGDADEDDDADGLTALQEQTFGTNPLSADTDGDGSADGAEIAAGTDPLDADSDDDGLSDGAEAAAGTDPLDADSDDDGVADGADQVSISTTDPDSGATVTLTGTGDISEEPTITDLGDVETLGGIGRVGPAIDIALSDAASSALTSASVTLPFDSGLVGASSVAIFTYDEGLQAWVPAADPASQTVDATAGTVTSPVSHFSMFAIFDVNEWFTALAPQ